MGSDTSIGWKVGFGLLDAHLLRAVYSQHYPNKQFRDCGDIIILTTQYTVLLPVDRFLPFYFVDDRYALSG